MKKNVFLIIVIVLLIALPFFLNNRTKKSQAATQDKSAIENIMTRTSVRSYSDRAVDRATVDTLLRAAMAAPTAVNKQPWRFVVIDNKEILKFISENFNSMKMAASAPVAIVTCGDLNAALEGDGRDYWIQDVSAATENLLLAAHAVGLGAVWCGLYPQMTRVEEFSAMLHLPAEIVPLACVCIGYPAGENTPKDKWNPENIRYNTWDGKPATLTLPEEQ